ncbi:MAG: SDR family oxidoreductase [Pseudonocardiaceae bacterium]
MVTGAGDGLGGGIARAFAAAGAAAVAHYCASKAAVIHFTRTAALEYGRYGIRVNGVSPGLIWRECLDRDWPDGVARFRQAAPLGRLGRPTDVGNACVFLSMISATVRPSTLPPSLFTGQDPSPLVGDLRSGHRALGDRRAAALRNIHHQLAGSPTRGSHVQDELQRIPGPVETEAKLQRKLVAGREVSHLDNLVTDLAPGRLVEQLDQLSGFPVGHRDGGPDRPPEG